MASEHDRALLRQEVEELTELLRTSPAWQDLRSTLATKGLQSGDVFLAGFMEDEVENEYGVFVTSKGKVYQYERSTKRNAPRVFRTWIDRTADSSVTRDYPAVAEALLLTNIDAR